MQSLQATKEQGKIMSRETVVPANALSLWAEDIDPGSIPYRSLHWLGASVLRGLCF